MTTAVELALRQHEVLAKVAGGYGHRTARHIAGVTGRTESSVRRDLTELAAAGLVIRNPVDKLTLLWKITPAGRVALGT